MMPKKKSEGEEAFALHCHERGVVSPLREWRFDPTRRYRFDFAWPAKKIAVEVEGGIWSNGRHTRPSGFANDCEKYNLAALNGWRVLRYTTEMVMNGTAITDVIEILR